MRNFALVQSIGTFMLLLYMILLWGLPIAPALVVFDYLHCYSEGQEQWLVYVITGLSASSAFIIYMFGLMFFSAFSQRIVHVRVKGDRKVSLLASWDAIRWGIGGQLHRATWPVLTHVIPSSIANTYYRLAGAKIGKGVQINTVNLNDPSLITIEDGVVIGGNSVVNGHIVEKGQLILAPILFKKGCLIGSRTTIQPGCVIGEGAVVATNALVGKWKHIPDGEVWAGLPASCIKKSSDRPESEDE
jgi:acetyltransferase-like isoleucine patch superfamily enzyme